MSLPRIPHPEQDMSYPYPPTRAYRTRVCARRQLSPHFTRLTFHDAELAHFGTGGLDQRIKLMLRRADGGLPDVGLFEEPRPAMMQWYQRWRALPEDERNPIRTYTVRAVRPAACEIDVDFALHGAEGPASAWAMGAREGDEMIIIGPDARAETGNGGIAWDPGAATEVLLAGDETAAPAICSVLESLDERYTGQAFIEVPTAADVLETGLRADVAVHWLARDDRPHGAALTEAVRAWGREHGPTVAAGGTTAGRATGTTADTTASGELTDPDPAASPLWEVPEASQRGRWYAWLAGEAGIITGLRRHLVKDLGIDRRCVSFMGYWRTGRAEGN